MNRNCKSCAHFTNESVPCEHLIDCANHRALIDRVYPAEVALPMLWMLWTVATRAGENKTVKRIETVIAQYNA